MATTIAKVKPSFGKVGDNITIIGTGFVDSPESVVLCRKSGDAVWTVVDAARIAYVSATEMTLTLNATEFDEGGLFDIGVADSGETAPDDYLEQALYFYIAGTADPDAVIKGAPEALYIAGRFMGHTHGGLELEHEVETSDVEVDQSLLPVRSMKAGESFAINVPLAEVSLENLRDVWGVSSQIEDLGSGRRRLTFGGDVALNEVEVMLLLPAGSGKTWCKVFYRCAVVAPGTMTWSRDDQVDLPLRITVLADTSRPAGDQVGYVEEYTAA